jgi:hypothetical protein
VTTVVAFVAAVVALTAALCGHQGQPFPPARWWRAARCALAGAPQGPSGGSRAVPEAPGASRGRTAPRTPTWAHSQPIDYGEAA